MATYFISDLHLQPEAVENTKLFLDFLQTKAVHADALYILGDLFAVWFGDDLNLPYANSIRSALKQLTDKQVPVYFMPGNRDFLIGKQFCQASGIKLLADPCVVQIYDHPILLTHGDLLCSADQNYQRYRKFVQNSLVKWLFLLLPKTSRIKIGLWAQRQASSNNRTTAIVDPKLYDVVDATVEEYLTKFGMIEMIHGHTHKPAVHQHSNGSRYVLGDWTKYSAQILCVTDQCKQLQNLCD